MFLCMCSKNRNKKNNWMEMEKFNLPWKRPNSSSSDAILNNYQKITFSKKMYAANRQMVTLWLIMGWTILINDLIISRVSVVKNNLLGTFFYYYIVDRGNSSDEKCVLFLLKKSCVNSINYGREKRVVTFFHNCLSFLPHKTTT